MSWKGALGRWKPSARARTQILLAGVLWTAVGSGLLIAGLRWSLQGGPVAAGLSIGGGILLGLAKGLLALRPTAYRGAERIRRRGDGTCAGGFLSWQSWLLVLAMMAAGAALRHSPLPRAILGFLYVAVGTALLWSSGVYWGNWRRPC